MSAIGIMAVVVVAAGIAAPPAAGGVVPPHPPRPAPDPWEGPAASTLGFAPDAHPHRPAPQQVEAAGLRAGRTDADHGAEPATMERRLYLMGTEATVLVEAADRAVALAASEAAVRALEAAEARLSTWTEESELARLNRAPVGEPVALSPELAAELTAAEACRRETGGAFDPGVGPLVAAWGLRAGGRLPLPGELAAARAASGGEGLELLEGPAAVRRWPGLSIEEGGFGKGAALDAALAAAAAAAPGGLQAAWVDLGGQVVFLGRFSAPPGTPVAPSPGGSRLPAAPRFMPPDAAPIDVEIAHPAHRDRPLVALRLPPTGEGTGLSVATSGNSERGITVAGERRSHVLDPRTGEPAPDFGSLTVLASTALRADCLSTGLYALGPRAALAWAAAHPGVEVMVLRRVPGAGGGVEVLATPGLEGRLRVLDPAAVTRVAFGRDQPPVQVTGNEESRGAGASEASKPDRPAAPLRIAATA